MKVALIEVGLAEIPVAVLGDEILTRAEKGERRFGKAVAFCPRGGAIFYIR